MARLGLAWLAEVGRGAARSAMVRTTKKALIGTPDRSGPDEGLSVYAVFMPPFIPARCDSERSRAFSVETAARYARASGDSC